MNALLAASLLESLGQMVLASWQLTFPPGSVRPAAGWEDLLLHLYNVPFSPKAVPGGHQIELLMGRIGSLLLLCSWLYPLQHLALML